MDTISFNRVSRSEPYEVITFRGSKCRWAPVFEHLKSENIRNMIETSGSKGRFKLKIKHASKNYSMIVVLITFK